LLLRAVDQARLAVGRGQDTPKLGLVRPLADRQAQVLQRALTLADLVETGAEVHRHIDGEAGGGDPQINLGSLGEAASLLQAHRLHKFRLEGVAVHPSPGARLWAARRSHCPNRRSI